MIDIAKKQYNTTKPKNQNNSHQNKQNNNLKQENQIVDLQTILNKEFKEIPETLILINEVYTELQNRTEGKCLNTKFEKYTNDDLCKEGIRLFNVLGDKYKEKEIIELIKINL